ncbi:unnamed protein product, partial [Symbiodinium microadriaticum]
LLQTLRDQQLRPDGLTYRTGAEALAGAPLEQLLRWQRDFEDEGLAPSSLQVRKVTDFHGFSRQAALGLAAATLLTAAVEEGSTDLIFVTGRGRNSPGEVVLEPLFLEFLQRLCPPIEAWPIPDYPGRLCVSRRSIHKWARSESWAGAKDE